MIFDSKQPQVAIVVLPDGKRDVTVLTNEECFSTTDLETGDTYEAYSYLGNKFRTVYEVTADDVVSDIDKYLDYDAVDEPTTEQLLHDRELIDSFTEQLISEGLI
jgi:hypothetical protein